VNPRLTLWLLARAGPLQNNFCRSHGFLSWNLYQKLVVAPIPQYSARDKRLFVCFLLDTQRERYRIKDSGVFIRCTGLRLARQNFTFSVQDISFDKPTNSGEHRTKRHATRTSPHHVLCSRCRCYWDCKPTGEALDGAAGHRCF